MAPRVKSGGLAGRDLNLEAVRYDVEKRTGAEARAERRPRRVSSIETSETGAPWCKEARRRIMNGGRASLAGQSPQTGP